MLIRSTLYNDTVGGSIADAREFIIEGRQFRHEMKISMNGTSERSQPKVSAERSPAYR